MDELDTPLWYYIIKSSCERKKKLLEPLCLKHLTPLENTNSLGQKLSCVGGSCDSFTVKIPHELHSHCQSRAIAVKMRLLPTPRDLQTLLKIGVFCGPV